MHTVESSGKGNPLVQDSAAARAKQVIVAIPILIYDGYVIARNPESARVPTQIHFDNSAKVNVINQRFALLNDLEAIDAPLPSPKWMDGNTTFYYAAYLVPYKLQGENMKTGSLLIKLVAYRLMRDAIMQHAIETTSEPPLTRCITCQIPSWRSWGITSTLP